MKAITRTTSARFTRHHRLRNIFIVPLPRTSYSTASSGNAHEVWVFIASIFPIRLGTWDVRHLFGLIRQDSLVDHVRSRLSSVNLPNLELLSVEPHVKDGGVFAQFRYFGPDSPANTVEPIEAQLREQVEKQGGLPSWAGPKRSDVWVVKGRPWREDMNRFASSILKVTFDGPDVPEEFLYQLFRRFGRINDVSPPVPVSAGTLRSSTISFKSVRSAVLARNVIHGYQFHSDKGQTRLGVGYERPLQAHAIRDWLTKHPRIVLPIAFFLIGTLTYTIFDPIRTLLVQSKINNWFDYRGSKVYKWIRDNTFGRIATTSSSQDSDLSVFPGVWKERSDAGNAVKAYLSDFPTTIAFVHGPQGSGKSRMVSAAINSMGRKTLTIDCAEIYKYQDSDSRMVAALAQQTGYRPVFTFLTSVNNIIDIASVGIIGQKTGLSSSLTDQLKQILDVVSRSLARVDASHRDRMWHIIKKQEVQRQRDEKMKKVRTGEWHDGRLDCVAGNGLMSELGIGDEAFRENDSDTRIGEPRNEKDEVDHTRKQGNDKEIDVVNALPVIIIRNFEERSGTKTDLFHVLAQWAAFLVQHQIGHVIVLSDNREDSKRLAKALPSKPLNTIALSDADSNTALSFVQHKLRDTGVDFSFTPQTIGYIERLGGRARDLESLIYKVRNGSTVEDAVEDIINRGVVELRKNAFGDDIDDAKNLSWSREQAWGLMKRLATKSEVPYHDVLLSFPFNGDETALRNMEHAELITITTHNGRPATIRPGKPVYKYVFERLVEDTVFSAMQDMALNSKMISSCETKIRACEEELSKLTDIGERTQSSVWGLDKAVSSRIQYLLKKMGDAESKIEGLEKANARLQKVIAQAY